MLCSGILPINNMRDFVDPAAAISMRIPKHILEAMYGIHIIRDLDVFDNPNRPPTAHEMLYAYCKVKGYITNGTGRWDEFRATKELLRDFTDGHLLYITPPDLDDVVIETWVSETEKTIMQNKKIMERLDKHNKMKLNADAVEAAALDMDIETKSNTTTSKSETKREHKRLPRWGKKNKKLRDKTPYDEESGHGTESYVPLFKNRNPNINNK
jgi:large subunit GTPase 1